MTTKLIGVNRSRVYSPTRQFFSVSVDSVLAHDILCQRRHHSHLAVYLPLPLADLVGFTAWSSMREPASVFILLETLFRAFDKIAAKRMVYKVETIGDCYGTCSMWK